jgi:hypothetical protein
MLGSNNICFTVRSEYTFFDESLKEFLSFCDNTLKISTLEGNSIRWKSKILKYVILE